MRNAKCEMQNVNSKLAPKCYERPELEILELKENDIIVTSLGTETTPKEDNDGIWDLDLG